jgi:hypothetical protein
MEVSMHDDDRLVPDEWTVFPAGLSLCPVCGEARGVALLARFDGTTYPFPSPCLCDGLRCRCGRGMIRRPAADFYDWRTERWWHVAWFGHRARCATCEREAAATAEHEGGEPPARRWRRRAPTGAARGRRRGSPRARKDGR